jgi:hypothetical protein
MTLVRLGKIEKRVFKIPDFWISKLQMCIFKISKKVKN